MARYAFPGFKSFNDCWGVVEFDTVSFGGPVCSVWHHRRFVQIVAGSHHQRVEVGSLAIE